MPPKSTSSGASPKADAETDALIRAHLDVLAARHTELKPLRSKIPRDLRLTPKWVAEYNASAIPATKRSLLLRCLFGDPSTGLSPAAVITATTLGRLMDWWRLTGVLDDGYGWRESIPKFISTATGIPRETVATFLAEAFCRPWWTATSQQRIDVPAYAGITPADFARVAAEIVRHRTLTPATARGMIEATDAVRSTRIGRWFFETGVEPLDLANALTLIAALLDGDREGGRVQNRLPMMLTTRWGLRRLSIPDAIGFADVATFCIDGGLDPAKLGKRDWLGLAQALRTAGSRELVQRAAADALVHHRKRWVMTAAQAKEHHDEETERRGMYDSGAMFNITRLLDKFSWRGIGEAPLWRFAPYYAALAPAAVAAACRSEWDQIDARIAPIAAAQPSGTRARDIGNILAWIQSGDATSRDEMWESLPSVAKFALGLTQSFSSMGAADPTRPRRKPKHRAPRRAIGPMPLFDALLSKLKQPKAAVAYLLLPGYAGDLPGDGCVYMHRAHAQAYATPPSTVTMIGTTPLAWGDDPVRWAMDALTERAHRVDVLGPTAGPARRRRGTQ